jgi:hypothetical protein
MAPPRQLKPKVWKRTRIRRSSFVSAFILYRKYQELILQLIRYESPHKTKPYDSTLGLMINILGLFAFAVDVTFNLNIF